MGITSRLALSVFAVTLAGVFTPASAAPPSYELVCRGGGSMALQYKAYGGRHNLGINFSKAARAVGRTNYPGPGECAWLDRPLNAAEPAFLTYATPEGGMFAEVREGSNGAAQFSAFENRLLNSLVMGVQRGQVFRVMCFNNGRNLEVTGAPSSRK